MTDLWQDEGFGGSGAGGADDDWDEGDESLDTSLEDGFDDPDEAERDASGEDDGDD